MSDEDLPFIAEYAKSNRASCKVCKESIAKDALRMGIIVQSRAFDGKIPMWHHLKCFFKKKKLLSVGDVKHFNSLRYEDQQKIKGFMEENLPGSSSLSEEDGVKGKNKAGKKRKQDNKNNEVDQKKIKNDAEEEVLKAQSALFFKYRDQLKKHLNKQELIELLEVNAQQPLAGESRLLDSLADCMAFGALNACPECKGQLKLSSYCYKCTGNLTAWTKCQFTTVTPSRRKFLIPKEYCDEYGFLKKYKFVKGERVFPSNPEAPSTSNGCDKPLQKFQIAVIGEPVRGLETTIKMINEFGGKHVKRLTKNTSFIISTKEESEKRKKEMKSAETKGIFVVSEDFLDAVKHGGAVHLIKQHQLYPWGGDPVEKLGQLENKGKSNGKKSDPSKTSIQKIVTLGKATADPDSGLQHVHVYEEGDDVYNVVLGNVCIQSGLNSYYKLQLLKHDFHSRYYIFTAWGRVGTKIGGNKLENFSSVVEAKKKFKDIYLEKTDNEWENRKNFEKRPRFFYPLDIDYGQEMIENLPPLEPGEKSNLPLPVQELVCLLFDIESMKKTMLEFEIDLKKMPLGKLSKKQIQSAYSILTELQQLIHGDKNSMKILDASNRFYTLIPHDFGMRKPDVLDKDDLIKSKTEMLDSLLEIEVAYSMMSASQSGSEDLIDVYYKKLKTDIEPLERDSKEFRNIEKYLQNTHAKTHNQYTLEILQVFKIIREGESDRYMQYKDLPNRKLLWHGSRVTNFAGILSQGLRIAPPEAPVTGYMFGKGIYFADMVSKSANYCFPSYSNPTGLLLLCEVALGNMYERTGAEFITKLPADKNSTKGVGQTTPNPKGSVFENGVEIPLGKPLVNQSQNSSLLYNEYIVYDVNQVNIKYLLEVDFKWRR